MRITADMIADGYEALFPPLVRAAHRACLEHARLTCEDGWPTVEGCLAFAKLYGVFGAELAAFFGHLCYGIVRRPTVWVNVLADEPGSHAARQLATRAQLTAGLPTHRCRPPRLGASEDDAVTGRAEREAQAQSILADARERADQRRAANPAAAGTIMHYARLKAQRLLADGARLQLGRDARDLDGKRRLTKQRVCLRCRKDFHSAGAGNRMCLDCQMKAAEASPYAL